MEFVLGANVRDTIEGYFDTYDVRVQEVNKNTHDAVVLISARHVGTR